MRQDAPRNKKDRDDGLSDFYREPPISALDGKELDISFNRTEPDAALETSDPVFIHVGKEPDTALGGRDLEIVFNTQERDTSSRITVYIGIALLILGSIGALAWWGRSLIGMPRDEGTSAAQIQNASQPAPTVPPQAPTNVLPPAPDPEPRGTDMAVETPTAPEPAAAIATPTEAPAANALGTPQAEATRRAEPPPVDTDTNAAGGLFAITRPVGAQVFVDDKLVGTTPLFMSRLSSGSHDVRLELPGFRTYSSSIQVEPKARARLAVQLEATR